MSVANILHDLQDRLSDVFADSESLTVPAPQAGAPAPQAAGPGGAGAGWPIEAADLFVVDPGRLVVVSTLGDPELARAVVAAGHPAVGVAAPTATENIGVEKLVRNVLAAPGIQVLVLAGPETGGTAPTGHYAGDALCALHERGIDPETMRIVGARGRRPFVKNLLPAEVAAFRRQVRLVDLRGEVDLGAVLAAVDAVGGSPLVRAQEPVADGRLPPFVAAGERWISSEPTTGYRPDPLGYVLLFADHVAGRLILEHYTADHRRTTVITGHDPAALAQTVVEHGLVGTLDHACYLGRELQRAAEALARGTPYVQDVQN